MDKFLTAYEAAAELNIKYPCLIQRIRYGKIKAVKKGWAVLIHKDEIAKAKNPTYITLNKVAKELGIPYSNLRRRVKNGSIKSKRAGRFILIHRNEVERIQKKCS